MRQVTLLVVISLLLPAALLAQAPAAPAAKVAIIDFQAALAGNTLGKKAQDQLAAEVNKKQADMEKTQKSLEDAQNKLRTQSNALSDDAKANLSRDIDRMTTDLQRKQDDAQKELQELQQTLLRPIAERLQKVLDSYANEMGYSAVLDAMTVVWAAPASDITTEIIRRIDADIAATPAPAAAPRAAAPAPPAAAAPKPAAPAAPAAPKPAAPAAK
jgi:Skp family chaperone for outer membrane proteins